MVSVPLTQLPVPPRLASSQSPSARAWCGGQIPGGERGERAVVEREAKGNDAQSRNSNEHTYRSPKGSRRSAKPVAGTRRSR